MSSQPAEQYYTLTKQQIEYAQKKKQLLSDTYKIPPNQSDNESARIFIPEGLLTPQQLNGDLTVPGSLARLLTLKMDVSKGGDKAVSNQDGITVSETIKKFGEIPNNAGPILSPYERMLASRIIVASACTIYRQGGYPMGNPKIPYPTPIKGIAIVRSAPQFENKYLEYRHFIVDPKVPNGFRDAAQGDLLFAERYLGKGKKFPTYAEATADLVAKKEASDYIPVDNTGRLLNKKAYLNAMKEGIALELKAADEIARGERAKGHMAGKAHHKAVFAGTGFFADLDGDDDNNIGGKLSPLIAQAYKEVLQEHTFPNIGTIEFPVFGAAQESAFDDHFKKDKSAIDKINTQNQIAIISSRKDVLSNEHVKAKNAEAISFNNAGDAFAAPGNEGIGIGKVIGMSVDAAIGRNTNFGITCLAPANPALLLKKNVFVVDRTLQAKAAPFVGIAQPAVKAAVEPKLAPQPMVHQAVLHKSQATAKETAKVAGETNVKMTYTGKSIKVKFPNKEAMDLFITKLQNGPDNFAESSGITNYINRGAADLQILGQKINDNVNRYKQLQASTEALMESFKQVEGDGLALEIPASIARGVGVYKAAAGELSINLANRDLRKTFAESLNITSNQAILDNTAVYFKPTFFPATLNATAALLPLEKPKADSGPFAAKF